MEIKKIVLGVIENNTYVISNGKRCLIVDPSDGFTQIMEYINEKGLELEAILITHGHWDHVYSLNEIKEENKNIKSYMHKADVVTLEEAMRRLHEPVPEIDVLLEGGEELEIIGKKINVIHAPGHAEGCVCFTIDDNMFCGDVLFKNSIGRTDLSTSDPGKMVRTLKKLSLITQDYNLFCGHGDDSSLQYEIENNPYFVKVRSYDR